MVAEDLMADAYFPKDILVEILSRLPVKSLLRFKVVCKSWRSLISSSKFINTHLSLSTKTDKYQRLLLSNLTSHPPFSNSFSLASTLYDPSVHPRRLHCPFFDRNYSEIVGTCNGLFCCVSSKLDVILWNPSTREFKTLPRSGTNVVSWSYAKYGFGYDKSTLPHSGTNVVSWSYAKYGFGYDKSLDDYKVVEILFPAHEDKTNVKIYSLRTNSWRTISALRRGTFIQGWDHGAFANGTLYWVAKYQESSCVSLVLVSFNMESEKFGMVKVPNCEVAGDNLLRLVVLNGYLSMFCKNDKDGIDVWIMNEDGPQECWTKLASMANAGGIEDLMPLSILGNDEILVYCLNGLAIYNTKNDTHKKVGVYDPHVENIDIYTESLISPNLDSEGSQSSLRKRNRTEKERSNKSLTKIRMASKYTSKRASKEKVIDESNFGERMGEGTEKTKWNDNNTEEFLKVCVEEVVAGNRLHSHFTREGWKNLIKKFNERTCHSYVYKQLKNRWDVLKKEFSLWAKLVQSDIGLGWDPVKRTIQAPEKFWVAKGKENAEYMKWKNEGPKFLDLLETCFKDVVATENAVFVQYDSPLDDGDDGGLALEGDWEIDEATQNSQRQYDTPDFLGSSARNKRKRRGKGEKRVETLKDSLDRLLVGIDQKSRITVTEPVFNDRYSIARCLGMLNEVPGLEKGSYCYFLAARILARKQNREAFVHFMENDPELTLGWLNTFRPKMQIDVDLFLSSRTIFLYFLFSIFVCFIY